MKAIYNNSIDKVSAADNMLHRILVITDVFMCNMLHIKKPTGSITEQMAYAVGVVGMALTEWQTLSPNEWTATAEAYNKAEEQHFRTEWERMRMLATISVQPHVKNRLTPSRLLPFPWENGRPTNQNGKTACVAPPMGKEEARKRFLHLLGKG